MIFSHILLFNKAFTEYEFEDSTAFSNHRALYKPATSVALFCVSKHVSAQASAYFFRNNAFVVAYLPKALEYLVSHCQQTFPCVLLSQLSGPHLDTTGENYVALVARIQYWRAEEDGWLTEFDGEKPLLFASATLSTFVRLINLHIQQHDEEDKFNIVLSFNTRFARLSKAVQTAFQSWGDLCNVTAEPEDNDERGPATTVTANESTDAGIRNVVANLQRPKYKGAHHIRETCDWAREEGIELSKAGYFAIANTLFELTDELMDYIEESDDYEPLFTITKGEAALSAAFNFARQSKKNLTAQLLDRSVELFEGCNDETEILCDVYLEAAQVETACSRIDKARAYLKASVKSQWYKPIIPVRRRRVMAKIEGEINKIKSGHGTGSRFVDEDLDRRGRGEEGEYDDEGEYREEREYDEEDDDGAE